MLDELHYGESPTVRNEATKWIEYLYWVEENIHQVPGGARIAPHYCFQNYEILVLKKYLSRHNILKHYN